MNNLAMRKMNGKARLYIQEHPECTHEELVKALNFPELKRSYFSTMRNALRRKGLLSSHRKESLEETKNGKTPPASVRIEILETIEAHGMTEDLRGYYKTHFLPLLRKLHPYGHQLQLVFPSDPPTLEIRRIIS